MEYILPFIFSALNRLRGSGLRFGLIKIFGIAKFTVPVVIWAALGGTNLENYWYLLYSLVIAYFCGESLGWGKWVATLCDRESRFSENEGLTILSIRNHQIKIWDGIHHIANFFIPEKKDYLNYSRLALAIRGIYWWLPVLSVLAIFNVIEWSTLLWALPSLSISFPISFELARLVNVSFIESRWEKGEIVYGFIHGIVFMLIKLLQIGV